MKGGNQVNEGSLCFVSQWELRHQKSLRFCLKPGKLLIKLANGRQESRSKSLGSLLALFCSNPTSVCKKKNPLKSPVLKIQNPNPEMTFPNPFQTSKLLKAINRQS
jgi:hypothetical protein